MSNEQTLKDVIAGLKSLLEQEKVQLLAGRFDGIASILQEKQKLSSRLDEMLLDQRYAPQAPAFRRNLSAIVALAQENETLLASARIGVKAAQKRIQDIVNRQRNIGVYGETGEKLMTPDAGVTRRKLA
ncbi:MAG: hypothetical protein VX640_04440 [Pseudomonadota bacterium]|nr:hypothetical protein [Pseudomonadota bacterium]